MNMRAHHTIIKTALLFLVPAFLVFNACTKTNTTTVTKTDTINHTITDTIRDTVVRQIPMGPIRPVTASSNMYITNFFEFTPAPGQFLNTTLADSNAAKGVLGNTQGLVSLGAWGGYVVYGFDHTVVDTAGPDVLVIGNAFAQFAEPGVVYVMQDLNGNGKPDDTWYELAGSETGRPGYRRNYAVTYTRPDPANGNVPWKDNQGNSGFILTNIFNTQDYYPDAPHAATYTLTGTLLPSYNIDTTDPTYITSASFAYGYCDNSAGGDRVDISTAIDSTGKRVHLKGIDFVKIQTGILFNMGWLGEQSTEVCGVADISLLPPGY
jgi:hypothetical protein